LTRVYGFLLLLLL